MITDVMHAVDHVLDLIVGLDVWLLMLMVVLFTTLETTALIGSVVPGDAVVLLAASTIDSPLRFGFVLAAAAGGSYAGDLAGYGIGRVVGPRVRTSRLGRMVGEDRWMRAETYLAGRGASMLIPVRFVAMAHAVTPVVAGTVRMPLRKFLLFAGIGSLSWAAVYTTLGTAAGVAYREYRELGLLTTVAVIVGGTLFLWLRRLVCRRSRRRRAAARRTEQDELCVAAPTAEPR